MDLYSSPEIAKAVVPTLALPLAAVTFLLNALVSWIAAFFGLKLRWQGPRRLLRELLKPRVFIGAILLNGAMVGIMYGRHYLHTLPVALGKIEATNRDLLKLSGSVGVQRNYTDWLARTNEVDAPAISGSIKSIEFKQIWRVTVGTGVFAAASVSGDSVFVGSRDGYVYEFNELDGRFVRRFFVGTEIYSEPIIWKNRLFVGEGTHDIHGARLYAFDLKSGEFVGAFATSGHTEGTPTVVQDAHTGQDHLLLVAGRDGIYSIDPLTLKENWHFIGGHTDADPRIREDRVYFSTGMEKGSDDPRRFAYALDLQTGAKIWTATLPASGWMPAVFVDNQVCFGVGEIYSKSNFGQLSCYDRATGAAGSAVTFAAPLLSIPLRVGNQVGVADRDGEVCALQFPQGSRNWCLPTHGENNASLMYLEPGIWIYPAATEGLLALESRTGRIIGKWKPTQTESEWKETTAEATLAREGSEFFLTDFAGNLRKIAAQINPATRQ